MSITIIKLILSIALLLLTLWLGVSATIFRFRHPWATETELFLHLPEAVTLQRVERPNY